MRLSALARAATLTLASLVLLACSSSTTAAVTDGGAPATDASAEPEEPSFGGARPVSVHVPPTYAEGKATPLVVLLHGYGAAGNLQELYFGLTAEADARGFLYAFPNGTVDRAGKRFWNAASACCDFDKTGVDDTAYVNNLIKEIQAKYTVDPKRIFLVGHSNGGFMSHRMACAHAEQIAAIASLAGTMAADAAQCVPSQPVSVLQIHGTQDAVVAFGGGDLEGNPYPGAELTMKSWAARNGCSPTPEAGAPARDLDAKLPGAESKVTRYAGCKPGGAAELWAIEGGVHIPALSPTFNAQMLDFLFAHPKP